MKTFREFIKTVVKEGLVKASSGNASYLENDQVCITRSGVWFEDINSEDILLIDRKGELQKYSKFLPSIEYSLHLGIYDVRKDVNCILHCQSPYATAFCCSPKLNVNLLCVIPEIRYYCKCISVIDCFMPGSLELSRDVSRASCGNDIILLKNHGQVILGESFEEVLQRAIFLELASKIVMLNNFYVNII